MSDAVAAEPEARDPASVAVSGPTPLAVGVVVWLASELMFFAGLFAGWFSLKGANDVWPPEDVELAVPRTAAATVALIVSSVTMHFAVTAAERQDRRGAIRWLTVTGLLGALFLLNLGLEYAELDFDMGSHAYGSIFFLMTGFHGLHLLGGILFMIGAGAAIAGPTSRAPAGPTIEVCAYYWHFVDVVWVAMFATIYILS